MNTSHNYADFISMCLDSDDDFEPYGYATESLQHLDTSHEAAEDKQIESVLFGPPSALFE